jgi:16S rRNA processing protein RimM
MAAFDDLITIGQVIKPQGRRGEVLVEPLSDRPERFPGLRRAYVPGPGGKPREVAVTSCWPHKGRFVLKLEGVDSIDDAEAFRGLDLRIAETELEKLPAGSYYHYQLKGLEVVDVGGRVVGRVHDLLETGAAVVLVIRGEQGETLLPLADAFVQSVDLAAARMTVKIPELVTAGGEAKEQGHAPD